MPPVRPRGVRACWGVFAALLAGCADDSVVGEGLLGEPIGLMTGDASPLPRLAYIDEGCPGPEAAGGCTSSGARRCRSLLLDSLAPLTTLSKGGIDEPQFAEECFEVRSAEGLAAPTPTATAFEAAVARFRFRNVPLVRAPADGTSRWVWTAGTSGAQIEPDGVLGGNVMRQFALAIRSPAIGRPSVGFYAEFPGSARDLADQGRAYIAVQFPGRLLGRDIGDRCDIGGDDCFIGGFDIVRGQPNIALESSRMVLDACVAAPPCAVGYTTAPTPPGTCGESRGPSSAEACVSATDDVLGGESASLVVATGVPGVVLFDDSARRMFGEPTLMPACDAVTLDDRACLIAVDGQLAMSGWPTAGVDVPLPRLRVRSVGLVAGLTQTRDIGPCERLQHRRDALLEQCTNFTDAVVDQGDIRNTTPPYSAGDANSSIAVLGEVALASASGLPDTDRWLEVHVLPATHPLAVSLRQDVTPEAIQPDGLVGTALLRGTLTVLDYTDPNPGVRVSCLDPRAGTCMVAPDCDETGQAACCFGAPLDLLVDFIVGAQDETCCAALSEAELAEIQALQGVCLATQAP